ncbi:MAG: hypothetical protein K9N49_05095 [Candidatus Marinimicrobia bacterium]|nr:hypothetical protein [Candidatus Neomarinimicrobiota bacterium]
MNTQDDAAFISRHDLVYDRPPGCWQDGFVQGNGSLGAVFFARQAWPDGIYDGQVSARVSQSTNAVAVLAGFGTEVQRRAAMTTALDPRRCDVHSGMNMMALLHEALQALGMDAAVPDRIRRTWGRMLEHGATTTWESEEALERHQGLCFGFGAHPLNYLARTALGVVPLEPGYRRFSVRLVPHDMTHVRGSIATPRGLIEIEATRTDASLTLQLTVPADCEAVVAAPRLDSGSTFANITGDNNPAAPHARPVASCTFLRETLPALCMTAGSHEVTFT